VGHDVFVSTSHWQDAVIRQLEIIGEATKRLSKQLCSQLLKSHSVNGLDDFDFIQKAPSGGLIDPLTGDYFNTHILVDACIPYEQKARGKFPKPVTVSKQLADSLLDRWGGQFKTWFRN
jgi:hypothetical protein